MVSFTTINTVFTKLNWPDSGTRQGCPLTLLIYAVVADLYNMAIINHRSFKGHETLQGNFVKISAYANNIAVHLGLLADVKIYCFCDNTLWLLVESPTLISQRATVW
jgi:hypothetical protein